MQISAQKIPQRSESRSAPAAAAAVRVRILQHFTQNALECSKWVGLFTLLFATVFLSEQDSDCTQLPKTQLHPQNLLPKLWTHSAETGHFQVKFKTDLTLFNTSQLKYVRTYWKPVYPLFYSASFSPEAAEKTLVFQIKQMTENVLKLSRFCWF